MYTMQAHEQMPFKKLFSCTSKQITLIFKHYCMTLLVTAKPLDNKNQNNIPALIDKNKRSLHSVHMLTGLVLQQQPQHHKSTWTSCPNWAATFLSSIGKPF